MTKNITLAVDEEVLAAVRRYAAARDSSVNSMVRDFLTRLAALEERASGARQRIQHLSQESSARMGHKSWDRESLHEG